jgi:hypothetical protein
MLPSVNPFYQSFFLPQRWAFCAPQSSWKGAQYSQQNCPVNDL